MVEQKPKAFFFSPRIMWYLVTLTKPLGRWDKWLSRRATASSAFGTWSAKRNTFIKAKNKSKRNVNDARTSPVASQTKSMVSADGFNIFCGSLQVKTSAVDTFVSSRRLWAATLLSDSPGRLCFVTMSLKCRWWYHFKFEALLLISGSIPD